MRPIAYKHYLLTVLTVILAFNWVDRVALGLLLQQIKVDLLLSDTQLGFLSGIAFALFYSTMGLPIARWADRGNRVTITALAVAIWSVAVALCGVAGSFLQLLLIRVVVAVGEAGCVPPAYSLIADAYRRAERPRAVAIYSLGVSLGTISAFVCAGWLAERYGWRMTFVLLATPGVVLAVLAKWTLVEPRANKDAVSVVSNCRVETTPTVQPSLKVVAVTLWTNSTFRHLLLYFSLQAFFAYGILTWLPAFFVRSFGMSTGMVGTSLALTYGLGGAVGNFLGGELASRYAAGNERLQLRAMAMAMIVSAVLSMGAYLSHNPYLSFGLIGLSTLGIALGNGPVFGTLQTLVPPRMRAVTVAIVYLCSQLIGMGLGPLLTGVLSDGVRPWAGEESLRFALLLLGAGYFWGAWHGWRASRTVTRDLSEASLEHEGAAISTALAEHP